MVLGLGFGGQTAAVCLLLAAEEKRGEERSPSQQCSAHVERSSEEQTL